MKTPEEIKRGLECCGEGINCGGCPYDIGIPVVRLSCMDCLCKDALAYIRQLERERAAFRKDIFEAQACVCFVCKHFSPGQCAKFGPFLDDFAGVLSCGQFEWRGAEEGKQ